MRQRQLLPGDAHRRPNCPLAARMETQAFEASATRRRGREDVECVSARVAPEFDQQVIDDATDSASSIAFVKREQLGVQGDLHTRVKVQSPVPSARLPSGMVSDPARWPARRSPGGDASVWIAAVLLFGALAALVFG